MAPPFVKERPLYVTKLLATAKWLTTGEAASTYEAVKNVVGNEGSFVAKVPLNILNLDQMCIPGVWPLEGAVKKTKDVTPDHDLRGSARVFSDEFLIEIKPKKPGLLSKVGGGWA